MGGEGREAVGPFPAVGVGSGVGEDDGNEVEGDLESLEGGFEDGLVLPIGDHNFWSWKEKEKEKKGSEEVK